MKKGDIVIIFTVVIMSISSMFSIIYSSSYAKEKDIVIEVGGEEIKRISVDDKTNSIYDFNFGDEVGYIEIKTGKVRMLEMDKRVCRNKICSLTGWINEEYETIVCLPNKIAISIENTDTKDQDIDEVSY
ncbi:NusG domain II-containing protein [Wukongibacter baidiensis]|uniref:NusG domain II-containing protein n=1 Tax=Wukongibacter baidiensis TaxID=1723361 RepID=UPI003D7FB43C